MIYLMQSLRGIIYLKNTRRCILSDYTSALAEYIDQM